MRPMEILIGLYLKSEVPAVLFAIALLRLPLKVSIEECVLVQISWLHLFRMMGIPQEAIRGSTQERGYWGGGCKFFYH